MPAVIPDNVSGARQGVADAGSVLQDYAGKEFTIGEELKKVLNEATTPGKTDWANINATNMSNYLGAPTKARAMYRDPESENYIFNPHQSAEAMQEYIAADEIPFLASSQLFGLMMKGEKDMIDSGTNAFKAKQAAAQAAYQVARETYSDLLEEFKLTETLRQQDEQLAISRLSASRSGGGGYTQTAAEEKKAIIREANKLPADKRANYIASQGYNPGDAAFDGLMPAPTDWGAVNSQAQVLDKAGAEYTINPQTGQISMKEKQQKQGIVPDDWWLIGGF